MRDPYRLAVFEKAHLLALHIYALSRSFPVAERFGLTNQMRRNAVSIPSNIVEGCSRQSDKDYGRFIEISYGSACELQYQLKLAGDLGLVKKNDLATAHSLCVEVSRMLGGINRYLRGTGDVSTPNA